MRKTRDPITGFRDRIIGAELAETSEIKAIELEVKQSVDADVKKAKVRVRLLVKYRLQGTFYWVKNGKKTPIKRNKIRVKIGKVVDFDFSVFTHWCNKNPGLGLFISL